MELHGRWSIESGASDGISMESFPKSRSIAWLSPLNRSPIRENDAMSGAITVNDVIPKCREKLTTAGTKVPASIIFHFRSNVYTGQ